MKLKTILLSFENHTFNSKFNWTFTFFSCWIILGHYIDLWAHMNRLTIDQSFLNPWHAFLYSGLLCMGSFFILHMIFRGKITNSLPVGYGLSLLGILILGIAGISDMLWHTYLGRAEVGLELFVSPPHILIAIGDFLIVSGPLRNLLETKPSLNLSHYLPTLISLSFLFSILTYMSLHTHPFVQIYASGGFSNTSFQNHDRAIYFILLQTIILLSIFFTTTYLKKLPFWSFTLIFTINALLMCSLRGNFKFIPGVVLSGILTDFLFHKLISSKFEQYQMQISGFLVPVIYWGFYFLTIIFTTASFSWSSSLWVGTVFVSGIIGLMLSSLLILRSNNT